MGGKCTFPIASGMVHGPGAAAGRADEARGLLLYSIPGGAATTGPARDALGWPCACSSSTARERMGGRDASPGPPLSPRLSWEWNDSPLTGWGPARGTPTSPRHLPRSVSPSAPALQGPLTQSRCPAHPEHHAVTSQPPGVPALRARALPLGPSVAFFQPPGGFKSPFSWLT